MLQGPRAGARDPADRLSVCVLGRAGDRGRGRQGAARHRLPLVDTLPAPAPHRRLRLREEDDSLSSTRSRRTRSCSTPRSPRVAGPSRRTPRIPRSRWPAYWPSSCAAARPRQPHYCAQARGAGLLSDRRRAKPSDLRRRAPPCTPASRSSAGLHARTTTGAASSLSAPTWSPSAFLKAHRGLPSFLYAHTMDPHVADAPPLPFDRDVRAARQRRAPRATCAPTTRSRSTASE